MKLAENKETLAKAETLDVYHGQVLPRGEDLRRDLARDQYLARIIECSKQVAVLKEQGQAEKAEELKLILDTGIDTLVADLSTTGQSLDKKILLENLDKISKEHLAERALLKTLVALSEESLSRAALDQKLDKILDINKSEALKILARVELEREAVKYKGAVKIVANRRTGEDALKLDLDIDLVKEVPNETEWQRTNRVSRQDVYEQRKEALFKKYEDILTREGIDAVCNAKSKEGLLELYLAKTKTLMIPREERRAELVRAGIFGGSEEIGTGAANGRTLAVTGVRASIRDENQSTPTAQGDTDPSSLSSSERTSPTTLSLRGDTVPVAISNVTNQEKSFWLNLYQKELEETKQRLLQVSFDIGKSMTPGQNGHYESSQILAKSQEERRQLKERLEHLKEDMPEYLPNRDQVQEELKNFNFSLADAQLEGQVVFNKFQEGQEFKAQADYQKRAEEGGAYFASQEIFNSAEDSMVHFSEWAALNTAGTFSSVKGLASGDGYGTGAEFVEGLREFYNTKTKAGSIFGSDAEFADKSNWELGLEVSGYGGFNHLAGAFPAGIFDIGRVQAQRGTAYLGAFIGSGGEDTRSLSFTQYKALEQTDSILRTAKYSFQVGEIAAGLALGRPGLGHPGVISRAGIGALVRNLSVSGGMGASSALSTQLMSKEEFSLGQLAEDTLANTAGSQLFSGAMMIGTNIYMRGRAGTYLSRLNKGEVLLEADMKFLNKTMSQARKFRGGVDFVSGQGDLKVALENFKNVDSVKSFFGAVVGAGVAVFDSVDVNKGVGHALEKGVGLINEGNRGGGEVQAVNTNVTPVTSNDSKIPTVPVLSSMDQASRNPLSELSGLKGPESGILATQNSEITQASSAETTATETTAVSSTIRQPSNISEAEFRKFSEAVSHRALGLRNMRGAIESSRMEGNELGLFETLYEISSEAIKHRMQDSAENNLAIMNELLPSIQKSDYGSIIIVNSYSKKIQLELGLGQTENARNSLLLLKEFVSSIEENSSKDQMKNETLLIEQFIEESLRNGSYDQRERKKSELSFEESLDRARNTSVSNDKCRNYLSLIESLIIEEDISNAKLLLAELAKILKETAPSTGQDVLTFNIEMSLLEAKLGSNVEMNTDLSMARRIVDEKIDDEYGYVEASIKLGEDEAKLGLLELAKTRFQKAKEISGHFEHQHETEEYLKKIVASEAEAGLLKEALDTLQLISDTYRRDEAFHSIIKSLGQTGNISQAHQFLKSIKSDQIKAEAQLTIFKQCFENTQDQVPSQELVNLAMQSGIPRLIRDIAFAYPEESSKYLETLKSHHKNRSDGSIVEQNVAQDQRDILLIEIGLLERRLISENDESQGNILKQNLRKNLIALSQIESPKALYLHGVAIETQSADIIADLCLTRCRELDQEISRIVNLDSKSVANETQVRDLERDLIRNLVPLLESRNPKGQDFALKLCGQWIKNQQVNGDKRASEHLVNYLLQRLFETDYLDSRLGEYLKGKINSGENREGIYLVLDKIINQLEINPDLETYKILESKGLLNSETLDQRVEELQIHLNKFEGLSKSELDQSLDMDKSQALVFYLLHGGEHRYSLINNYNSVKFQKILGKVNSLSISEERLTAFASALENGGLSTTDAQAVVERLTQGRLPVEIERSHEISAHGSVGQIARLSNERFEEKIWGEELRGLIRSFVVKENSTNLESAKIAGREFTSDQQKQFDRVSAKLKIGNLTTVENLKSIANNLKNDFNSRGLKLAQELSDQEVIVEYLKREFSNSIEESGALNEWLSHLNEVRENVSSARTQGARGRDITYEVSILDKQEDYIRAIRFADAQRCCFNSDNYNLAGDLGPEDWIARINKDPLSFIVDIKEKGTNEISGFAMLRSGIDPSTGRVVLMLNGVYSRDMRSGVIDGVLKIIEEGLAKPMGAHSIVLKSEHAGTLDSVPDGYDAVSDLEIEAIRALESNGNPEEQVYDDIGTVANGVFSFTGYRRILD